MSHNGILPGWNPEDPRCPALVDGTSGKCSCCRSYIGSGTPVVVAFDDITICGECACNVLMRLATVRSVSVQWYMQEVEAVLGTKQHEKMERARKQERNRMRSAFDATWPDAAQPYPLEDWEPRKVWHHLRRVMLRVVHREDERFTPSPDPRLMSEDEINDIYAHDVPLDRLISHIDALVEAAEREQEEKLRCRDAMVQARRKRDDAAGALSVEQATNGTLRDEMRTMAEELTQLWAKQDQPVTPGVQIARRVLNRKAEA